MLLCVLGLWRRHLIAPRWSWQCLLISIIPLIMPWICIWEFLQYHWVPMYLHLIVEACLTYRTVIYLHTDYWSRWKMSCGVPQGLILSPLLWNSCYDWVLHDVKVTCYSDDTLVTAHGKTHRQTAILATAGVVQVVSRIRRLGLEIGLHKFKVVYFRESQKAPLPGSYIVEGGVHIPITCTMKYLRLVLDAFFGDFYQTYQYILPKTVYGDCTIDNILQSTSMGKRCGSPKY